SRDASAETHETNEARRNTRACFPERGTQSGRGVRLQSLRTNHVKRRDRGGRREEMPKDFSACSASSAFNVAFFHRLFSRTVAGASVAGRSPEGRLILGDGFIIAQPTSR